MGRRNRALLWIAAVALLMLVLILGTPLGRELFHFGELHADDVMLVALVVVCVVGVLETAKRFWRAYLVR